MNAHMEELYHQAKRFDESELYQSDEYAAIAKAQMGLYKKMYALFGAVIAPILEEYHAAISDELELECRHFFEQGYLLGRRLAS